MKRPHPSAPHIAFFLALATGLALAHKLPSTARDRSVALAEALRARGLPIASTDVRWIDVPGGVRSALCTSARAIVRAIPAPGEPHDLFLVHARLSPDGVLLGVGSAYNLTETSSADEELPVIRGERIAYVARPLVAEAATTVHVLDLAGQRALGGDWTALERAQNAITNLQQMGQLRGIDKRTFGVERRSAEGDKPKEADADAALAVAIDLDDAALSVHVGTEVARVALDAPSPELPAWLRAETSEIAHPGNLVTWSVDRVRAIPWIGDDTMQTIKAVAFTALDFVLRNKERVTGDNGAAGIADDLGKGELDPATRAIPVDPEIGWPPPPLEPWVTPALPGEGVWTPVDEVYVRRNPGLPPAFVSTFIRSDRERKATRVYVALWDPRQVELHMMAGTVEPKGATGEAGPGLIPRSPEVMKRVVAASNAGFQALHGEFGMMADGVVYLPPKPYAATVATLRDGTNAFGTWPADTSIPDTVLSYRQNMTVMVQDEQFNPYKRTWWGGTPPGWEDKTHTVRTGICLTKERFIAYFYGNDIGPEALAQSMIQARCAFGIALDMNAGHSGLELYKVAPADDLGPLGHPLDYSWEREGDVLGVDGWKFRARRFIKGMGLMNFPRYIRREARDFFYMTLRNVLPGDPIAPIAKPALPNEGEWRVKGLPQHGFPYAIALTDVRPDPAQPNIVAHVLKMDPRTVTASGEGAGSKPVVVALDAGPAQPSGKSEVPKLWLSSGGFSIAPEPPVPEAVRLATAAASGSAAAAVGVRDEDGMLYYVELAPPGGAPAASSAAPSGDAGAAPPAEAQGSPQLGKALDQLLERAGCSSRMLLPRKLGVALGGDTDLAGAPARAPSGPTAVRLVRAEAPGARRFFEDTPVVPFSVWYPLQQQRIRYFKKHDSAEAADAEP